MSNFVIVIILVIAGWRREYVTQHATEMNITAVITSYLVTKHAKVSQPMTKTGFYLSK